MGYLIKMPQMGMSMDEGEVIEWVADEDEEVEEEDVVVIVESEKASSEVTARESGAVRRILVEEGGVVEPGVPIGILASPDEEISDLEEQVDGSSGSSSQAEADTETKSATTANETPSNTDTSGTSSADDVRATPGATRLAEEKSVDLTTVDGSGPGGAITEDDVQEALAASTSDSPKADGQHAQTQDVRATPGATQLAEEKGIDIASVEGSGPGGAVIEDDVKEALESGTGETEEAEMIEATAEPRSAKRSVKQSAPLTGMQQTISDRLSESYRNAVHVTINREFEISAMDESLTSAETLGIDISLNDVLLKAVADTLSEYPEFNALYEDGEHKQIEEVNIGVAVDNQEGLLTPVVSNVDEKSLAEVKEVRRTLTERVLDNEYSMDDLDGGTFTISNLGMFGVDHFDPVINPPQVAILGVGRTREDGRMTLSLSFDHRILNGVDAARFLDSLVERLTSAENIASYFSNRA